MSSKKKTLYKKIFKYLRDTFRISPKKVMSDFEASLRNAIKETWENSLILGCRFHYKQALRRKMMSIRGMKIHIQGNAYAQYIKKFFTNLPLLPQNLIFEGFDEIMRYQRMHNQTHKFKKFNKYFVKVWLNNLKSYKVNDHRTNNFAESFNAKFKRIMHRNPSTYAFLSK